MLRVGHCKKVIYNNNFRIGFIGYSRRKEKVFNVCGRFFCQGFKCLFVTYIKQMQHSPKVVPQD